MGMVKQNYTSVTFTALVRGDVIVSRRGIGGSGSSNGWRSVGQERTNT